MAPMRGLNPLKVPESDPKPSWDAARNIGETLFFDQNLNKKITLWDPLYMAYLGRGPVPRVQKAEKSQKRSKNVKK
jgi:hypothetical protein